MDPFLGEIRMFAGNYAPQGWALCDGRILQIAQNQALFSILGTTYGGDGRSTFALPDLRGRVPVNAGNGPGRTARPFGSSGGAETVTLTANQMPNHTHPAMGSSNAASQYSPAGQVWANETSGTAAVYNNTPNTAMHAQAIGATGGNQPHENMPPFLCVNFIIALEGIYPSRS